jgi:hypothetical protein
MKKDFLTHAYTKGIYEQYQKALTRLTAHASKGTLHEQTALFHRASRYERRLTRWGIAVSGLLSVLSPTTSAFGQTPQGLEFRCNTYTTYAQQLAKVASDANGNYVVVWQSNEQDEYQNGIYGQRYNASGTAQGTEFRVNTYTANNESRPSVSMDSDGDFVVVWQSYSQNGSYSDIYGQRYNASGTAQGAEFRVNTYNTNNQSVPSVSMDSNGDFVVVWVSLSQTEGSYGIYGQRYNASGTAQGTEFRVNTYTSNTQSNPSVSLDSDGDFVVVWMSNEQDGIYYGIYGQRYNASGTAQGTEFQVNTYTSNSQSRPSVSMDSNGNFVIVWQSYRQDGSYWGIYGQRYNASGTAQGTEFRVNTYTTSNQVYPSVSLDSDGDFVVVWHSNGQNENFYGIYGQRYSSAILPIELQDFTGKATAQGNELSWHTAQEIDFKGFDVERSADGKVFTKIGAVGAKGSNSDYHFRDAEPLAISYYRLKSNDLDGKFEYSKIIALQSDSKEETVRVYPTQVHDVLTVEGATSFEIVNSVGQVVLQSYQKVLSLQALPTGMYFVRGRDAQGKPFLQKIVKNE